MPIFMPFQGPEAQQNSPSQALEASLRVQQMGLDKQRLAAEERRTQLAERGRQLEEMAAAWKVLPPGSPQRVELMNRLYGLSGGSPGAMKIPPVEAEKVTERLVRDWAKTSADLAAGKRLPQDAMQSVATGYLAATRAIYDAPGYDAQDRQGLALATRDVGQAGLEGLTSQGMTVEHGIRTGQTVAGQKEVEGVRHTNRMTEIGARGTGGSGGQGWREESSRRTARQKAFDQMVAADSMKLGRMSPDERQAFLTDAWNRAGEIAGLPGNPSMGPPAPQGGPQGPQAGGQAPTQPQAAAGGREAAYADERLRSTARLFDEIAAMPSNDPRERFRALVERARQAGFDVMYDPVGNRIVRGQERPGDADLLAEAMDSRPDFTPQMFGLE